MELVILLFILVGLVLLLLWFGRTGRKLMPAISRIICAKWGKLENTKDPRALLEADKLLDFVLANRGYRGSLGEKLKQANACFSNPNAVWQAHKARNQLAHELEFKLTEKELQKYLQFFKRGLKDLGVKGLGRN